MTPQEKARELVQIYFKLLGGVNKIQDSFEWERAIQCALIAVDEILKSGPTKPGSYITIYQDEREAHDYWQQVKTEIQKL